MNYIRIQMLCIKSISMSRITGLRSSGGAVSSTLGQVFLFRISALESGLVADGPEPRVKNPMSNEMQQARPVLSY